ncbi:acyltransferase family protein [Spongorhabdus nitratireducens]
MNIAERRSDYDSIRAVAALMVAFAHWFMGSALANSFMFGRAGVVAFFVLSGMFIGRILFYQSSIEGETRVSVFLKFALSRILRIVPPYIFAIFLIYLLGYQYVQSNIDALVLFVSNFDMVSGSLYGYAVHFWTISVEVQFYIFWAVLFFLMPSEKLRAKVLLLMIVFGFFWRLFSSYTDQGWVFSTYLLPGCIDSFAVGLLLTRERRVRNSGLMLLLSIVFLLSVMAAVDFKPYESVDSVWFPAVQDVSFTVLTACLIIYMDNHKNLINENFLFRKVLAPLGLISYGFYIWHYFAIPFWAQMGVSFNSDEYKFLAYFSFSFIAAGLSWFIIEKPAMKLRRSIVKVLKMKPATADQ